MQSLRQPRAVFDCYPFSLPERWFFFFVLDIRWFTSLGLAVCKFVTYYCFCENDELLKELTKMENMECTDCESNLVSELEKYTSVCFRLR